MEENFNPVAQTRANYYTPGSPVQFVCVELLKGDVSGEHAVCLTFKNISRVTLTALEKLILLISEHFCDILMSNTMQFQPKRLSIK